MRLMTPETKIYIREDFDAVIASLCGWTNVQFGTNKGVPPSGIGTLDIPKASQHLSIAWGILQRVQKDGGDIYEKMYGLLTPDELWSLSPDDAAHMICNAFHVAHTGCSVEIEDAYYWDDD